MTINNADSGSTAANRIYIPSGSNFASANDGSHMMLVYDYRVPASAALRVLSRARAERPDRGLQLCRHLADG
jgi:hypothetical protein